MEGSFSNGISIAEFNPSTLLLYYYPLYIIFIVSSIGVSFFEQYSGYKSIITAFEYIPYPPKIHDM